MTAARPLFALLLPLLLAAALGSCVRSAPSAGTAPAPSGPLARAMAERALAPLPEALPPRARFLEGLRVCLDPGHGGDTTPEHERTRYKRGPTGLREAVVNLAVAAELRAMLEASGAKVLLTRDDDSSVTIERRVELANEWRADLFISIHHNAAASPAANYSSVWYPGDGSAHPAAPDLARALSDGLQRHLALPNTRANGAYSDVLMYASGFGVLRGLEMPGVLAECSFFTHPPEEELLRDPAYNRRTAHALLDGLADWAANGVPRWSHLGTDRGELMLLLSDGMKEGWGSDALRIREGTVEVLLDGERSEDWAIEDHLLRVRPRDSAPEDLAVAVRFQNRVGNSSITGELLLRGWRAAPLPEVEASDVARAR